MSKMTFFFDQDGQEAQCVFDVTYTGLPVAAIIAMKANVWDNLRPETGSECSLIRITLREGNDTFEVTYSEAGTGVGSTSPVSNCILVSKHTIAGRNGRFFWPGAGEGSVDANGRLTTAKLAAWQLILDQVMVDIDAGPVSLHVERADGTLVQVDRLDIRPVIGTQRRRLYN